MKNFTLLVFVHLCYLSICAQGNTYQLVWSDEFNVDGPLDATKWHHQIQLPEGGSWYNGEIQHYTNRIDNSFVSDGTLKIVAKKETYTDQGYTKSHTSARLNSKFAFTYGYVEIRAKLPQGIGTWPAMWTLGQNIIEDGAYWSDSMGTVIWPACGEIDIMEHWGSNQNYVQSATHTPSSFGNTVNLGGQNISTASSEFHIYALEWTPDRMVFSIDGTTHYIYEPTVQDASTWPFDANQYILLNVAVLPEILDSFTESALEIDYIRVFQDPTLSVSENQIADKVTLFPNPVIDSMSIQVPSNLVGTKATVHTLSGKELFTTQLQEENTLLNLSAYAKGVYFITITNKGKRITKQIIKQ